MFNIALINMPFSNLGLPSIALTQLQAIIRKKFSSDRVSVEVHNLNFDFARFLGQENYEVITNSIYSLNSGIGDWFFRQVAFPETPDNTDLYTKRYFQGRNREQAMIMAVIREKRPKLGDFINSLIDEYGLDGVSIVGLTSMFSQNCASIAMARSLKLRNSKITTVMGGANCESPMGQELVKNVSAIDFVFSGPALHSFAEFVGYCIAQEFDKISKINGVISRKTALLVQGAQALGDELSIDEVLDLDYEPYLHDVEERFSELHVSPSLPFETSRGCWWGERAHCTFCGLNGLGMIYRSMEPEKALKQFDALFKFWPRVSRLEAVDNIVPQTYLQDVFSKLKTPPGMHLFYEVRANLSDEEMAVLSQAGVKVIQPGIESLATSTLKRMKKGTTAFNNLEFLKLCLIHDVYPAWNLLIGFPGEPASVYEKYLRDLPKFMHLPPPTGTYPVRFDRYSPYFDSAQEYGLKLQPLPFYGLVYPFSAETCARMAYYFSDHNYASDYMQAMVQYIDPLQKLVEEWKERWHGDRPEVPMLYVRNEAGVQVIHDSRSRRHVEYEIDSVASEILNVLQRRKHASEILSALEAGSSINVSNIEKYVNYLVEKDLVFEEGGRLMSLVLLVKTESPSCGLPRESVLLASTNSTERESKARNGVAVAAG